MENFSLFGLHFAQSEFFTLYLIFLFIIFKGLFIFTTWILKREKEFNNKIKEILSEPEKKYVLYVERERGSNEYHIVESIMRIENYFLAYMFNQTDYITIPFIFTEFQKGFYNDLMKLGKLEKERYFFLACSNNSPFEATKILTVL